MSLIEDPSGMQFTTIVYQSFIPSVPSVLKFDYETLRFETGYFWGFPLDDQFTVLLRNASGSALLSPGVAFAGDPVVLDVAPTSGIRTNPYTTTGVIPEPTTILLFAAGILGLFGLMGRKRLKSNPRMKKLVLWPTLLIFSLLVTFGSSLTQAQAACVQPPSGMIAWWSLDETSGTIADDRVGDNPGAYANNPVPASGMVRGALRFNGSNYVAAPDSDLWAFGANDFTVELWANFDQPGGGSVSHPGDIFIGNDEGPGSRNKWFFALGGGSLNFHINSPTIGPKFFPLVPFSPIVGQWYHLAVTRSGSTYTLFINGTPGGSATNTDVIPNPNAPLTIGQAENLGFMNGRLDEISIYNRALTQEELKAIYDAGSAGKCIDLTIRPEVGGDTGSVSVHINGTGFAQGAAVKLMRVGNSDIVGTPVTVGDDGTTIDTTFDLTGKTRGVWDVVVENPDGTFFVLTDGFTIEEGGEPQMWVDIVGLGLIRSGRDQFYSVVFGNSGNVDCERAAVIIGIPRDVAAVCTLSGTTETFNYEPNESTGGADPDYVFVEADVGPLATSEVKTIQCKLRVSSSNDVTIHATAFEDKRILSGFEFSISPENVNALQITPGVNIIVFDGYGPLPNGNRARITHPFLIIDNDVYSSNGGVLVRWPIDIFIQFRAQVERTKIWTIIVDGRPVNVNLLRHAIPWPEVQLINHPNFPGLDPAKLKADLNNNVGQPAGNRDCIQILDFYGESDGLNLLPESFEEPANTMTWEERMKEADEFLRRLNIDPLQLPTTDDRNPEGRSFQLHIEFLIDWLRGLGMAIQKVLQIVFAFDPNDKTGSQGAGDSHYLSGEEPLRYSIFFENLETATAPAQEVVITDQLDTVNMDLSTLSLGPIAFGNKQAIPPSGVSSFATNVDLRPDKNLIVRITASLNPNTGLLTWRLTSIDPATGNLPEDPRVGFLPPNINPPEGDGSVLFTVMPKKGLSTGTQIRNWATIVFDVNPPINTPEWFNTLDNTKPTSQVLPLADTQDSTDFLVEWSGADEGAGIRDYTVFVSVDGGNFTPFLEHTPDTSATFSGEFGKTYAFYSVATDSTGNIETKDPIAEAVTTIISEDPLAGLEVVDAYIQKSTANTRFDRITGLFSLDLILKNISDKTLLMPFIVVVTSISSPDITVASADGETLDGKPYFDYSSLLVDGKLLPGQSILKRIAFNNPKGVRFTYTTQAFSKIGE